MRAGRGVRTPPRVFCAHLMTESCPTASCWFSSLFWGRSPPPGGEAPSNVDLVMSVCVFVFTLNPKRNGHSLSATARSARFPWPQPRLNLSRWAQPPFLRLRPPPAPAHPPPFWTTAPKHRTPNPAPPALQIHSLLDQSITRHYLTELKNQNGKVCAEYVWIGGSGQDLRSKARTLDKVPTSIDVRTAGGGGI